jgi:hypothetical protein
MLGPVVWPRPRDMKMTCMINSNQNNFCIALLAAVAQEKLGLKNLVWPRIHIINSMAA